MANAFDVSGTYVENCTCATGCLCCEPGGETRDDCRLGAAWTIESGRYGATRLDGLKMVGVYDVPCSDPDLRGTLYADERASADQRRAIEELFLGGRCNRPGAMEAVVRPFQTIRYSPVTVSESGGRVRVEVPGVIATTLELIPVGQPTPAPVGSGRGDVEAGELGASPRRYGFHSRFRWIG